MSVSWEKVRLVGQFEILAQDNFFPSKVRLVGQLFLRSCPTGRTLVYDYCRDEVIEELSEKYQAKLAAPKVTKKKKK